LSGTSPDGARLARPFRARPAARPASSAASSRLTARFTSRPRPSAARTASRCASKHCLTTISGVINRAQPERSARARRGARSHRPTRAARRSFGSVMAPLCGSTREAPASPQATL